MLNHKSWLRFVIIVVTGITLFPFLPAPVPVAADGTVTNCHDDQQFSNLLPQGGIISFNCGGAYTITVSSQKVITTSVSIDRANGGFPIVLSGGGVRRIFSINRRQPECRRKSDAQEHDPGKRRAQQLRRDILYVVWTQPE